MTSRHVRPILGSLQTTNDRFPQGELEQVRVLFFSSQHSVVRSSSILSKLISIPTTGPAPTDAASSPPMHLLRPTRSPLKIRPLSTSSSATHARHAQQTSIINGSHRRQGLKSDIVLDIIAKQPKNCPTQVSVAWPRLPTETTYELAATKNDAGRATQPKRSV